MNVLSNVAPHAIDYNAKTDGDELLSAGVVIMKRIGCRKIADPQRT